MSRPNGSLNLATVNKAIRGVLRHLEFEHGHGYHYLIFDDGDRYETRSIMIARLSSRQIEQIYRIVQELFVGIVKHAEASRAGMSLKDRGELAILTGSDNGRGMSSQDGRTGGLGLNTASQRAVALGAEWETETGENGTTVRLTFPINTGSSRTESDNQNNSLGRQSSNISSRYTRTD